MRNKTVFLILFLFVFVCITFTVIYSINKKEDNHHTFDQHKLESELLQLKQDLETTTQGLIVLSELFNNYTGMDSEERLAIWEAKMIRDSVLCNLLHSEMNMNNRVKDLIDQGIEKEIIETYKSLNRNNDTIE